MKHFQINKEIEQQVGGKMEVSEKKVNGSKGGMAQQKTFSQNNFLPSTSDPTLLHSTPIYSRRGPTTSGVIGAQSGLFLAIRLHFDRKWAGDGEEVGKKKGKPNGQMEDKGGNGDGEAVIR